MPQSTQGHGARSPILKATFYTNTTYHPSTLVTSPIGASRTRCIAAYITVVKLPCKKSFLANNAWCTVLLKASQAQQGAFLENLLAHCEWQTHQPPPKVLSLPLPHTRHRSPAIRPQSIRLHHRVHVFIYTLSGVVTSNKGMENIVRATAISSVHTAPHNLVDDKFFFRLHQILPPHLALLPPPNLPYPPQGEFQLTLKPKPMLGKNVAIPWLSSSCRHRGVSTVSSSWRGGWKPGSFEPRRSGETIRSPEVERAMYGHRVMRDRDGCGGRIRRRRRRRSDQWDRLNVPLTTVPDRLADVVHAATDRADTVVIRHVCI